MCVLDSEQTSSKVFSRRNEKKLLEQNEKD